MMFYFSQEKLALTPLCALVSIMKERWW
uniref:Uncharacterized protein n=1 Tax=Arundo donax TaxID=35708 RepID=A0A0A9ACH9_ARUDO